MQFCEVVGQQSLKKHLIDLINRNHMPHACMLLGKEGSGGLPLALATAQYIMCKNRSEFDSCGDCAACIKNKKLQHPDVHYSFPTFKKDNNKTPVSNDFIVDFREQILKQPYLDDTYWLKALDTEKQGNITANECREIIQKLQLRSFESKYKVLIMWYPEYLGNEGNVLLKLIEEPTTNTILLFVAHNLEKVLLTIQSRTQLFMLERLQETEIQKALIEQQVNPEEALQIARLADGNYFQAQQLLITHDDDLILLLRTWLNCLYANKGIELVNWITEISEKSKDAQKKFLQYYMQLLEEAIRAQHIGIQHLTLLETEQKIIEILLAKGVNYTLVNTIRSMIDESIYQIERNANTKILFHSLSLRIQQLIFKQKAIA